MKKQLKEQQKKLLKEKERKPKIRSVCEECGLLYVLWSNFILGPIFFSLFLYMVIYDNEYKTKKNEN